VAEQPGRIRVTANLKLHPKDQSKLELMASRISMETSVSSVSWIAKEAEPTPE
jgi:putative Mg2+ transporter-C (MgtC) family protein